MAATDHYLIVGGGPVGFATALLLAKKGIRSTVFEGRDAVINIPEESYPIGVNARGLHTMELIDPAVAQECRDTGKIINSWQIFGGKSKVAHLDSGVVYGTSRARVNLILAEAATRAPFSQLITIENNHRLRDVRLAERELVFDVRQADGTSKRRVVEVPEGSRVVASDGVNSAARRAMEAQDKSFQSKVTNWKNEFRVLFAPPGATAPDMDVTVHYIFNGFYAATVDNAGQQQWSCVMGARDGAPAEERRLLLSTDPSEANVAALRALIEERAPRVAPLFGDDELRRYFDRRTFRGAIVECNRVHVGEWLVLLGDAAHSVLPPTGEGINSGLEDAMVLAESVAAAPSAPFSTYDAARADDIRGLVSYATYLNDGFDLWVPGEGGARLAFTILETLLQKCGVQPITESLFGPSSSRREPYGAMAARWTRRRWVLLPIGRLLIYPWAWLFKLLGAPFAVWRALSRAGRGLSTVEVPLEKRPLQPPILDTTDDTPSTAEAMCNQA